MSNSTFESLKTFFERDVSQKATAPLRDGIQIALIVPDEPTLSLIKQNGRATIVRETAKKPDMTFTVPLKAVETLTAEKTEDIGEIGIAIIKLMMHEDSETRLKAKVHIGLFDLLRNGYLGVLPLGGPTVMKFLASKGFNGIGKIKEGISKLRDQK